MITDPTALQAVIEWTHCKTKLDGFLRRDEWYALDPDIGLIIEIRAYYARAPTTAPTSGSRASATRRAATT
jgi:hypothetical protein